jgi:hypothetical protein
VGGQAKPRGLEQGVDRIHCFLHSLEGGELPAETAVEVL